MGQDQKSGRTGEGGRFPEPRRRRDGEPAHVVGEQGLGDVLPACQAITVHEEVMERGPHGAEEVVHVLEEPGVRDAAAGKGGCRAAQHGDAGEEALLPDDPTAQEAALGGVPRRQRQCVEGGQVPRLAGEQLVRPSATDQEGWHRGRGCHREP
ncbi:hypothetical protein K469DRAFT_809204 [Zopfia rhizophila CBS 207.26]|uniref:Uncharacterized protein n=1 Tax=Zopfia rhizophila CBS 207.26 TaxID=1314779 RepID=A0A6A6EIU6_9PEZI|nr:hypothetical protein K469DRAFT_809204 [Zopfia rhizophila CBS 207.26]